MEVDYIMQNLRKIYTGCNSCKDYLDKYLKYLTKVFKEIDCSAIEKIIELPIQSSTSLLDKSVDTLVDGL